MKNAVVCWMCDGSGHVNKDEHVYRKIHDYAECPECKGKHYLAVDPDNLEEMICHS